MNLIPQSDAKVVDDSLVVDCGQCLVRSRATCADCVVTALLGSDGQTDEMHDTPGPSVTMDTCERDALRNLADLGLVPPLRLVVSLPDPQVCAVGS